MTAMQWSVSGLAAFAAEFRPDWNQNDISSAILAAKSAGWADKRILREVTRLVADDDAEPRELLEAARSSVPGSRWEPGVTERGAALVRAALAEALERGAA